MKIKRVFCALCFVGVSACGLVARTTRGVNFTEQAGLRRIGGESRTASFNEMVVRHAKRLCNGDLHHVFSQDGRDFVDFWETASEVNLDLERAYTCLRLFHNNIKMCETIDYTVVEHVTKMTPMLFERYFEQRESIGGEFSVIKDSIENLMLERFTDRLDRFHTEPDLFLTRLSGDVTKLVRSRLTLIQQENEEREFKEKLRNIVVRLSDMMINKLIWYENDYQRIWRSFQAIADSVHKIGTRGIINDQDNLDELWDSLVKRFVWYLEFRGSALPVDFYEEIEEDLKNNVVLFLELDEQDEGIKTKKEYLVEAIIKAKAKAIAFEQRGLVTDQFSIG